MEKAPKKVDTKRFASVRKLSLPSSISKLSLGSTASLPWTPQKTENVTPGPELAWQRLGPARDVLLKELRNLYWDGVGRELAHALHVLRALRPELPALEAFDAAESGFVHGFDSFVDRVCTPPGGTGKTERSGSLFGRNRPKSYLETLKARAADLQADLPRRHIKAAARSRIALRKEAPVFHKVARMVLQSLGLLDIDKIIEHRPSSAGSKASAPQLVLESFDAEWAPRCAPLRCTRCLKSIRGASFHKGTEADSDTSAETLCESCYRSFHLGDPRFRKSYKHCILHDIITPQVEREICQCKYVQHEGGPKGEESNRMFPITRTERHVEKPGRMSQTKCGFYRVKEGLEAQIAQYSGENTGQERRGSKQTDEHGHMAVRFGPLVIENGVEQ